MPVQKINKSKEDWKKELPADVYHIAMEEGTEKPHSHPYNLIKGDGVFKCAVCDLELFKSDAKFNSGTGWPSFFTPISQENVETKTDFKLGIPRTEAHCARCGAHLGHVFNDGPTPTGLRYCMNGTVLQFQATKDSGTES